MLRRAPFDPGPRTLVAVLIVLAAGTGITGSLGAPLVPEVAVAEGVRLPVAQWILTAPFLVGAVMAPVVGRLGNGSRRRPVLLAVLALAALGAVIAALPLGIGTMIAGRCLQGLAFSVSPLLFAVAGEALPEARRRSAIAALSVANVAAAGLGYPVTATVVELADVAAAFWVGAAFMLLAFGLAVLTVPGSVEGAPRGVDVAGAVLLMGGVLAVLLVISQARVWPAGLTTLLAAIALALLVAATAWFRRAPRPLVDVRLAARRGVLGLHVAGLLLGVSCYVLLGVVMVLVQADESTGYGQGRSVMVAGLMLTPYAAFSVVGNRIASVLVPRWGAYRILPVGCLLFAAACGSLALWHAEPWQAAVAMSIGGVAGGFSFNSIPWLMMQAVPAHEVSSSLGINIVARFVGFAIGSATSTAVLEGVGDGPHALVVAMGAGIAVSLLAGVLATWLLDAPPAAATGWERQESGIDRSLRSRRS